MSKFKMNDMLEDAVNDYRKQIEKALKRAEQRINTRLQELINEYMLDEYYNGYTPRMYVRIFQLKKALGPYTELKNQNNVFSIVFNIEDEESPYGFEAMDHSHISVKMIYHRKKKPGTWEKTYTYEDEDVNEKKIFDNFMAGIHPRAVGPVTNGNIREQGEKILDLLYNVEAENIINQEIDKIK